jgi:hypothetical protein
MARPVQERPLRNLDFSSWQSLLVTVIGLAVITLIGVGLRLVMMIEVQRRRERMNRQINERLRTLIGAYKTLGGSFTGELAVDPRHLRDLRRPVAKTEGSGDADPSAAGVARSDRARRIRDAVEAALSDIILLGTDEQVRLAACAARELSAGKPVHTHELVVSLRDFIREALDLDPLPADLAIPMQGPARSVGSAGRGKGERGKDDSQRGGGGSGGMGMGMGGGLGLGAGEGAEDPFGSEHHHS